MSTSLMTPRQRQIYRLMRAMNSIPKGTHPTKHGNLPATIHSAYNAAFPNLPLTQAQVNNLLSYGAQQGIFTIGGFGPNNSRTIFYYYVNPAMASMNVSNSIYINVTPDPTQPRGDYPPKG